MTLLEELKKFIKHIFYWIFTFAGFTLLFFIFGLKKISFLGKNFFLPLPAENSFSAQIFKIIQRDFLPAGVSLIVTNPWSGFVVQLEMAMILAFLLTSPFFIYEIVKYVSPALLKREKKAILKSLVFSAGLFLLGCLFAYYFMIPLTFKFMYPFAVSLGVIPYFSLDAFVAWVICIIIVTGITFLLPIFMIVLSSLGIVSPDFWRGKWRQAFLFLLIFSAVITPDQTGVTMTLLFIALAGLYVIGSFLAGKSQGSKAYA
jgi:sec-independent protein translocase protein TatC